ncbi:hypothetical protein RFI_26971, partial [Reticulomyxa filosa]
KKWSDKTLESLKQILEQPSISWNLLEDVFNIIIDIPVGMDPNMYVFAQYLFCTSSFFFFFSILSIYVKNYSWKKKKKKAQPKANPTLKPNPTLKAKSRSKLKQREKSKKDHYTSCFKWCKNKTIEFCVLPNFWNVTTTRRTLRPLHQSLLKLKDDDDDNNNKDTQDTVKKKKYKEFVHLKELYVNLSKGRQKAACLQICVTIFTTH